MIKLYLANSENKKHLADYLLNTLGQSELGAEIKVVYRPNRADLIIDLVDLHSKEQIAQGNTAILKELLNVKVLQMFDKLPRKGFRKK